MAKKGGKSKGYTSAGVNSNVSKKILNAQRSEYLAGPDRIMNQLSAFKRGKRVMVTIANPNKEQTNKRFIRVPGNTIWRDPKAHQFTA